MNKPRRANTRFAPTAKTKILAALFAEAKKLGIEQDTLRNEIAPAVIKKRLSMATGQEILRVIQHITGSGQGSGARGQLKRPQKYESSKAGLIQELEDAARARWGEGFAKSLNAFVNANRETQTHYKFLSVTSLKAIKERIKEMNRKDRNEVD